MNPAMQAFGISRMFAGTRHRDVDVSAYVDRTLRYDENVKNVRSMFGMGSGRDRGSEMMQQKREEQARERARRADKTRQSSIMINEYQDRQRRAMLPGKRFSASGHRYYERRANRSDRNPSTGV
jgi:hypothetical protein